MHKPNGAGAMIGLVRLGSVWNMSAHVYLDERDDRQLRVDSALNGIIIPAVLFRED